MWQEIKSSSIAFRKHLHQHPELTWQEVKTTEFIRSKLDEFGIAWEPCTDTGTIGRLAQDKKGKHIALRGDIDALPINENTHLDWKSKHAGCMHACGHDGHTATLLATAQWLKLHEASLSGPVSLIFQPAEEGGHGALKMIEQGALSGVDEIYGWHNWPSIAYGHAVCPEGPVMSANSIFNIKVKGVGGHGSQPESCRDPVLAGSAIVMALQQIVSRRIPPQLAAVVSVTSFDAKSASNVILEEVNLAGGIRAERTEARDMISELITEIADETARAYGCEAGVTHTPCYGATVNHAHQSANFRQALAQEFGDHWQAENIAVPIMASEDFSYFINEIPGAFALIGADDNNNHHHPCHSSHYDFNDKLIERVVSLYARLVGAPVPEKL
ncbi:N(2)-acetyl-L-2,4-diaminobutanoate deacetylase DoeB2 [Agarilytica rhodophyticola]|uniref:N(2)-acetyl-L-2,4-diaminobutanoate deacetylase DoeB2 n=1 Tax=Agarilytica rhodophyticola TaxID=1737490 RepID=UPI001FEA8215|nr:N(2)-acetyl-L-2,4-diaminobutanoate deacetylase DoeB2 [Agarilytica rhodophyticola]